MSGGQPCAAGSSRAHAHCLHAAVAKIQPCDLCLLLENHLPTVLQITAMEEEGEITEEDPIDPDNTSPKWALPEYPSDDEFPETIAEMLSAVAGE